MSEISDFLRARYLEARKREESVRRMKCPGPFDGHDVVFDSDGNVFVDGHEYPAEKYWEAASEPGADPFVLADLDAKLALVREHDPDSWSGENPSECPTCSRTTYDPQQPYEREPSPCRTLRILAQPFAGQPGHKGEEWAP